MVPPTLIDLHRPLAKRANTTTSSKAATPKHLRNQSDSLVASSETSHSATTVRGTISALVSRSRKSSMSTKNFQSLDGDEEEDEDSTHQSPKPFSNQQPDTNHNKNGGVTPSGSLRQRKPNSPPVRRSSTIFRPAGLMRIRAIHDLINVAPDELPFRAGDVLTVLDEQSIPEDANVWVRAEKDGLVGVVPMNYFELVHEPGSPKKGGAPSKVPSLRHQYSESVSPDETEESDSPSSSLLADSGFARRGPSPRRASRSHLTSEESLPVMNRYPPDQASMSSLEIDGPYGDDPYGALPANKTGRWPLEQQTPYQEMSVQESARRKSVTAPPSPSKNATIPAPSPRQLASSLANAAVTASGKKPPPPPPPARRSQSSSLLSGMPPSRSSPNNVFPPVLPPPRRPAVPVRSTTTQEMENIGVSPFDS